MKVSEFIKVANTVRQSYRELTCEFCGAETLCGNGISFCSNCESQVGSDRKSLSVRDPQLLIALDAIREGVMSCNFDEANAIYEQLLLQRQLPQLLYARGILLLQYSNYTIAQVNYNREGFMEANADLRDKGNALFSEAKKFLAKSAYQSKKELKETGDKTSILYRIMLCELKMSNFRAAYNCLGRMPNGQKDKEMRFYAQVVMLTCAGSHKEALEPCIELFEQKGFPSNAFYYLAFNLFKTGDLQGAQAILKATTGLMEGEKIDYLTEAIASSTAI